MRRSGKNRHRWPAWLTLLAAVGVLLGLVPSAVAVTTLALTPSVDPVEDIPVTIGVSGSGAASGRSVFMDVAAGDLSCAATQSANGRPLMLQYGLGSGGAFDFTHQYTPASPGTYTLCAYVGQSAAGTPDATQRATFTVRRARAAITMTPSSDAVEGASMTIGFNGSAEAGGRSAFVDVAAGDLSCAATQPANGRPLMLQYGLGSGGAFDFTHQYTPASPGTYTLCAYVGQSAAGTPDATHRATFTVRADPNKPPDPDALIEVLAPELQTPLDGTTGERLNPEFVWTAEPRHGAQLDRLRIQRDDDGETTKMLDITETQLTSYIDDERQFSATGTEYATDELASFAVSAGSVRVRLSEIRLAPGTYSWFVQRSRTTVSGRAGAPLNSASRKFTVEGPHLKRLTLSRKSQRGSQSKYPGVTTITARTTPYARVRISLERLGRRSAYVFETQAEGAAGLTVAWSCLRPGGRYRVTAEARDQYGARRVARTSFKPVSRARCRAMRAHEAAARRARERRRAAEQRAADRRAAREHADTVRRYQRNCRAIGGRPRLIERADGGSDWVCVAPLGGLLPVPGF